MIPKVAIYAAIISGVFAGLWAIDGRGYRRGVAVTEAAYSAKIADAQRATIAAAEQASKIEAARLAAQNEADENARKLEDEAMRDLGTACGLPASRVLRLQKR